MTGRSARHCMRSGQRCDTMTARKIEAIATSAWRVPITCSVRDDACSASAMINWCFSSRVCRGIRAQCTHGSEGAGDALVDGLLLHLRPLLDILLAPKIPHRQLLRRVSKVHRCEQGLFATCLEVRSCVAYKNQIFMNFLR